MDMTPILRRSKEAARVQRAKGTVRKNGPLGGNRPPGARGAQGRAGAQNRGAESKIAGGCFITIFPPQEVSLGAGEATLGRDRAGRDQDTRRIWYVAQ